MRMPSSAGEAIAWVIVALAAIYLVTRFTGIRWRPKVLQKPDVPLSNLTKKR